ncbi:exonuclease domain-containing protein [Ferrimicrobium acidiphilum]|uniref:DNA polymerase III PolC-type n=1 Tax=Ferrimicrobium acidiphilum DSM 19497 TaxID=1121877 RepID=A0A0D8FUY6_9ACTN|nr:exonuclease domain-containing protein [Ferrimicrobium acidiphilum]KJE76744.1 DNA polymerase III PolC-type [Ferrimicrobium acidiphilum DSM 19497]
MSRAIVAPSLSDLRTTTFVVVDTETTGGSARYHELTEIAALKVCGGEVVGHLRSLIHGLSPIPPMIVTLTGITDPMRSLAPEEIEVLNAFTSFVGDAVIVGHNLSFDIGFLDAALIRSTLPPISSRRIDTLRLARHLLRDEVENFKLATLARYLRLRTPSHRALADVLATTDLLHELIGRLGAIGITTFEEIDNLWIAGRTRKASFTRSPSPALKRPRSVTTPTD